MKLLVKILLIAIFILVCHYSFSQEKPVRIVFDITSGDTLTHQTVVRHVNGMATAYPAAQLEVVVYGKALPMVLTGKSSEAKKIQELTKNKNVSFKVCEGTMKRYNVTANELLPGVATVPDGILEIVRKQGEGWGYIKEAQN